jgi:hypothetical protein
MLEMIKKNPPSLPSGKPAFGAFHLHAFNMELE